MFCSLCLNILKVKTVYYTQIPTLNSGEESFKWPLPQKMGLHCNAA